MPVVRPNPNMFRIMDVGAAIQSGQDIVTNRLKNEALGLDVQEAQDMLARRAQANEIRSQFARMPDQIAELERNQLFDEADQLRDNYIKMSKGQIERIQMMREGINEENYDEVKQGLLAEGNIIPGLWPEEYSDEWFREEAQGKQSALSKLTRRWAEDGAVMSQDIVSAGGEVLWEGTPYEEPPKGAKAFEFKASDNNSIGREIQELYGGFYDPETGQFSGLNADTAAKVTAVRERATQIFQAAGQAGNPIPHSVAVAQAARTAGIPVRNIGDAAADNPLGLQRPNSPP